MKKEEQSKSISRRNFLKGTATGAAGIAAATMLGGCAPQTVATPATETQTPVAAAEGSVESALPEKARPIDAVTPPETWDYESDVVVVGGGGSGLAAAVTAAEKGATVTLLEKNSFCGGDTSCAMVLGVWGSKFQEKLGVTAELGAKTLDKLYFFNETSGNNAEMVRIIESRGGETADWLESIGVVYEPGPVNNVVPPGSALVAVDPEFPEEGYYRWWPHNAKGFTQAMNKEALRLGVNILLETPASALVTDAGKVVGVKATTKDGSEIYVKGKVTVLASGGYGANRDMLKAYVAPRRYESTRYWGLPSATGDGIRMAQGVGAAIYCMDELEVWDGPNIAASDGMDLNYTAASQLVRQKSLTVNKFGKRFFNESAGNNSGYVYQAAQKMAQLDHTTYTIFDANCIKKEDIIAKFMPTFCEFPIPEFEQQFEEQLANGTIMKADTLEDLAAQIGVDPQTFKETVDRYNEMCDKGEDTDFFKPAYYLHPLKTAPFYTAVEMGGSCYETFGGLMFDSQLRVLDEKRNAIPGLYVAGENAYCLNQLSRVIPGGRYAGENAATEALG
jgi:fumarate reductase flavoprotein subunit